MSKEIYIRKIIREELEKITNDKFVYFLRDTNHPESDLERGFSCYRGAWVKTEKEAADWQEMWGAKASPRYNEAEDIWCADPEDGLSAFSFTNEEEFKNAMWNVLDYVAHEKIAVFSSDDYDLGSGYDGEDIFRNGKFLFYINRDSTWQDFINLI